MPGAESRSA